MLDLASASGPDYQQHLQSSSPAPFTEPTANIPIEHTDPTWYIKEAVVPTSEKTETALTADPVVMVRYPMNTTRSLIGLTIICALLIALPVWFITMIVGEASGGVLIFCVLLCLAMAGLLVVGVVNLVAEVVTNTPSYVAVGSRGITVWCKKKQIDLNWTDIRYADVDMTRRAVYSSSYQTRVAAHRIRLNLIPQRLESVPRSRHAVLARASKRLNEPPWINAVVYLAVPINNSSDFALSAARIEAVLARFDPNDYQRNPR